jgi:hypothetical protein
MKYFKRVASVILAIQAMACSRSYIVVPATGGTMAATSGAGLVLDAVPNAWSDDPSDLNEYMTPIWVQVTNQRNEDVRVIYSDFALVDSSGFRYAAVSPYPIQANATTAPATPDTPAAPPPSGPHASNGPSALNAQSDWYFAEADTSLHDSARISPEQAGPANSDRSSSGTSEWYFAKTGGEQEIAALAPLGDGTGTVVLVRGGRGGGGGGRAGGGFGHFGGHHSVGGSWSGGARGGWHGGWGYGYPYRWGGWGYYSVWPHFYAWPPPYYGPYVYYWGPRYYPSTPTEDIMRDGLPQGVLRPGGKVSGFVYFQHAARQVTNLDLVWVAHLTNGAKVAALRAPLTVIED